MNTLVPLEYYKLVHYYFLMIMVFLVYMQSNSTAIDDPGNLKSKRNFGYVVLGWIVFYFGLRPLSGKYFADMRTYADTFDRYLSGEPVLETKDVYFEYFIKYCTSIMTVEFFFMLCTLLYVIPLYIASKRIFKEYWFYSFFMLTISMSFWAYGVNGIRNGIATSLFILAVSYNRIWQVLLCFLIGYNVHKSLAIPIIAYLLAMVYKDPKSYLKGWLLAIPLSLAFGGFWEGFFLNLGLFDSDRLESYLGDDGLGDAVTTGFRWDFLLYSASGVYTGWYFIIKKKFEDQLYTHLFNVYLVANAFWILVIRAAFSNRFAYLSWFLLGLIIIYPFLKNQFFHKQHVVVGKIILIYFLFTFALGILLK